MSYDVRDLTGEQLLREILLELQGLSAFLREALETTAPRGTEPPRPPEPAKKTWRLFVEGLKPLSPAEQACIDRVVAMYGDVIRDGQTIVYAGSKIRDATEVEPGL